MLAPREHLGWPFWHLGSTLGGHFGTSGARWGAILAPWDHPGGPWEQQDGFGVVNNRILLDFAMILGLVYGSFWGPKLLQIRFFPGLLAGHIFIDF